MTSLLKNLSMSIKIHVVELLCSVSKLSTESVGSRRELVVNSVHAADADADATWQTWQVWFVKVSRRLTLDCSRCQQGNELTRPWTTSVAVGLFLRRELLSVSSHAHGPPVLQWACFYAENFQDASKGTSSHAHGPPVLQWACFYAENFQDASKGTSSHAHGPPVLQWACFYAENFLVCKCWQTAGDLSCHCYM